MSGLQRSDQVHKLLNAVLLKVEENSENLYVFIGILQKDRSMRTLCNEILQRCGRGKLF